MSSFDSRNNAYENVLTQDNNMNSRLLTECSQNGISQIYKEKTILKLKELKKTGIKIINSDMIKKIIRDKLPNFKSLNNQTINNSVANKNNSKCAKEKKVNNNILSKNNDNNQKNSILNIIENINDYNNLTNVKNLKPNLKGTSAQNDKPKVKQIFFESPFKFPNNKVKINLKEKRMKGDNSINSKDKIININHNINHNINLNINNINDSNKSEKISQNFIVSPSEKTSHNISLSKNMFVKESRNYDQIQVLRDFKTVTDKLDDHRNNNKFVKIMNNNSIFDENDLNGINILNGLSNKFKKINKPKTRYNENNINLPPKCEDIKLSIPSVKHNLIKSISPSHSKSNSKWESEDILSEDESLFTNLSRKCIYFS